MKRRIAARWAVLPLIATLFIGLSVPSALAQVSAEVSATLPHTVAVGPTGFANKRPVLAGACMKGCPWGELGDFLRKSMVPFGYDVVVCENCNRSLGPGLVGAAAYPPVLTEDEMELGTLTRVDARIDFGISTSALVGQAYLGKGAYQGRPFADLRLITRVEDPYFLLVATKASSGISDLGVIKAGKLPVKVLLSGDAATDILSYYGISKDDIARWGGSVKSIVGAKEDEPFDLLIASLGAATYNPESWFWTIASQKTDLHFLQLPEPLLAQLLSKGGERVEARCCLLRGFTKTIVTVGSSGEAVFGRKDMPDSVAYDIAKAIDANHAALKWYVRPYSYDPDLAWRDPIVPLHPGATRYFRERGYMASAQGGSQSAPASPLN